MNPPVFRWVLLICVVVCIVCSVVLTYGNVKHDSLQAPIVSPLTAAKSNSIMRQAAINSAKPSLPTWKGTCKEAFEPKCDLYGYVKFWNAKFRVDDCFQSPLRKSLQEVPVEKQKFVVFEPDRGGWNNIRMAAETAIIIAHATGRVLVLPPETKWYLLNKNRKEEDNVSHFGKYFDLIKMMESLDVVTMREFYEKLARPGLLATKPPGNNTNRFVRDHNPLWKYLESACHVREWEPGRYFWAFNITNGTHGPVFGEIAQTDRMKKLAAHNRKPIVYDQTMHNEKCIYFPGDYRNSHRILTHFYSYIYWADREEEKRYKRLVRDRLHYHDDIFCAAGRAVKVLHEESSRLTGKMVQQPENYHKRTLGGNSSRDATYHAFHIRRGDFQYQDTQIHPSVILNNTLHLLDRSVSTLLYIATDERNKTMFQDFQRYFTVRFLDDVAAPAHLGSDHLNQNHVGMVEQVICANAHTFVGTPYSTFTGYITRIRGYYRDGRYKRSFYTMKDKIHQLQQRTELVGPFWAREFAVAHHNIDDNIVNVSLPLRLRRR